MAKGGWRIGCELRKSHGNRSPNIIFDFVKRHSAIEENQAFWFVLCQFSISMNHTLMEFIRFIFQPIANFLSMTEAQPRSRAINIEHEGEIRDAIVYGKSVQPLDELRSEIARRALVNRGRIKKAVANHPVAAC